MIIYSVTIAIQAGIETEWVEWMNKVHVPDVLQTGCFEECKFYRVLGSTDDELTYLLQYRCPSLRGVSVRNFCPTCGGLVFGGDVGVDDQHTVYAGALDDPSLFEPKIAIFERDRPCWVALPPGVTTFETMPG